MLPSFCLCDVFTYSWNTAIYGMSSNTYREDALNNIHVGLFLNGVLTKIAAWWPKNQQMYYSTLGAAIIGSYNVQLCS